MSKKVKAIVLKEFLILIVVYFKAAFAGSDYFKDGQQRCHLQTISCPCRRTHGEQLSVAIRKCASNNLDNVCGGKAAITKCRTAYLFQKRQRRDTGSQNFHCDHGTNKTRPNVTINGSSKDLKVDGNVRFECTVFSNLPANLTWLFNGASLAEKVIDGDRHSFLRNKNCRKAILIIVDLLSKDTGNYTCVVQNEMGKAMASSRLIVTRDKDKDPSIKYMGLEEKIGLNTAVVGSSLNLTCKSHNTKVINAFKKDGTRVKESDDPSRYKEYHMEDDEHNAKIANFEIKNVTFEDTGNYTCVAYLLNILKEKTFFLRIVNASKSCIPGHYCLPGSQQPQKCPAGTYQPSMVALSKNDCIPCNPGYHCPSGSISPVPCPWGSYQPLAGASTCKQCENRSHSKKPDFYIPPAVNITDCPPGYHTTPGSSSKMGKEQKFTSGYHMTTSGYHMTTSGYHMTSVEIVGVVIGVLGLVVIILLASICIARKWQWLSLYKTRKTSSNQHDIESWPREMIVADSEQNGLCVDTNDLQYSQVVKRPSEKDYDAKYDVFICYSSKDSLWVIEELLAELQKRGFTCCIDFKDFTIGAAIVENITDAIYHSKKTVAVLTPDFVNSYWCSHELQKALTRIRSHQVVPIVYKCCDIPLVLQDRTYLDWENCHVKPYFWEQLEKALRLPNDDEKHFDEPVETNPSDRLLV